MSNSTTTRRPNGTGAIPELGLSYAQLVKWGEGSVEASWRFGMTIESLIRAYTKREMAESLGVTVGTINRYHRFFGAFQRPELAVEASELLETFNIDLLWKFAMDGNMPERGRAMAGRHFRYRCSACHRTDTVQREEYDPETGKTVTDDQSEPAVTRVRFQAVS